MDLLTTTAGAGRVAVALGRASLPGGLLILAVWALCRLAPRLPAAFRTWLWWIACLRLLVGLVGIAPVRLPLLPVSMYRHAPLLASPLTQPTPSQGGGILRRGEGRAGGSSPLGGGGWERGEARRGVTPTSISLSSLGLATLGALWLLAVAVQLARAVRQIRRTRRTVRSAQPLTSGRIAALSAELCRAVGLSGVQLLASDEVSTPQATGLLRRRVLLPRPQLDRLAAPELSMVLCHELVHLRRGDLWFGWVPALAERLFFFHPLAALAAREYALAREAACDARVLAVLGEAPQAYGRLLLKLGIRPRATALAAATAAPSKNHLKRRLQMLEHRERRPSVAWWALLVLLAVVGLIPFRIVAAQEASRALLAVAGPPPQPPVPPRAPVAPHPPSPPRHHSRPANGEQEFVLLSANGSSTMSGSMSDIARAKKFLNPGESEILWFRRGGKEYVVRDPQTLKAARALFAPQAELGARQAELGSKQAELGSRQAALGAEQAKLGSEQAKLGAEQARIAGEEARRSVDGKANDDLSAQQDELGKKQDELGKQQDELGKKQDELGKQQDAMGRQQDELGKQQEKLGREADQKLRGLLDDAIAKGLAREVGT